MKPPETQLLKLKCHESLSNFAFKFNLRRYTKEAVLVRYGHAPLSKAGAFTPPLLTTQPESF